MPHRLSHEELLEKYLELQLRVTRFSAIEQELINTRDQMDQELEIYKRLNYFHTDALKLRHIDHLVDLATEAILDIFETEFGYCYFEKLDEPGGAYLSMEGISRRNEKIFKESLDHLRQSIEDSELTLMDQDDVKEKLQVEYFSSLIVSKKIIKSHNYELTVIAGITKEKEYIFRKYDQKIKTLFSIFLEPLEAFVSNVISSEKISEQLHQIQDSERELRKLSMIATKTSSGVIVSNPYGEIEWVNQAFVNTTGYELAEVMGRKPKDFLQVGAGNDSTLISQFSQQLWEKKGTLVTIKNRKKNGDIFYNRLEITPIFDDNGILSNFIAIQQDITAEQQYKIDLVRINNRFEIITETTEIGIWEVDLESNSTTWNSVLQKMYNIEDTEGLDLLKVWVDSIVEEDKQGVMSVFHQQVTTGSPQKIQLEYKVNIKGRGVRNFLSTSVIEESSGTRKLLGTSVDQTKSKHDAMMILEQNKELKKTNQELDQFVYSISHDLRSPLLSIKGILNLINDGIWTDNHQHYLSLIEQIVDRLDDTILEILDYSRNSRMDEKKSKIDLKKLIDNILQDLSHISVGINTELNFEGSNEIYADELRLNIVLKNLLSNALKYHDNSKEWRYIKVLVKCTKSTCSIIIEDNGEGISAENMKLVFDMFYRASTTSAGTGLGLYICKEVMNKLNGEITMDSEPGEGTVVQIKFPINE